MLDVPALVRRFGGSTAHALLDPTCRVFAPSHIDGAVGYKAGWGTAVAMGAPVCAPHDLPALTHAFRAFCRSHNLRMVVACASAEFAEYAKTVGYGALVCGSELTLSPRDWLTGKPYSQPLQQQLNRARQAPMQVHAYSPANGVKLRLERTLHSVAKQWSLARRGHPAFLAPVTLLAAPSITRCFYAEAGGRIVGVLSMLQLEAYQGYLLEHVLVLPDAPVGTYELLITQGIEAIGHEGCDYATFGAAPAARLGEASNLSRIAALAARSCYRALSATFNLEARTLCRQKFPIADRTPCYLLFDPPVLGVRQISTLLRVFNVSMASVRDQTIARRREAPRGR